MKLSSRKTKNTKIILLVVGIVLAIALVATIVGVIVKTTKDKESEQQKIMLGIAVASTPNQIEYYVGEDFNPSGTRVQVIMSPQDETYFVSASELEFSGFDSSEAVEKQVITVTYKGFSASFTVRIKAYENGGGDSDNTGDTDTGNTGNTGNIRDIEICDMILTYSLYDWTWGPSAYGAYYKITYTDGSTFGSLEETPVSRADFIEWHPVNAPGETDVVVEFYDEKTGIKIQKTITVTITN